MNQARCDVLTRMVSRRVSFAFFCSPPPPPNHHHHHHHHHQCPSDQLAPQARLKWPMILHLPDFPITLQWTRLEDLPDVECMTALVCRCNMMQYAWRIRTDSKGWPVSSRVLLFGSKEIEASDSDTTVVSTSVRGCSLHGLSTLAWWEKLWQRPMVCLMIHNPQRCSWLHALQRTLHAFIVWTKRIFSKPKDAITLQC